MSDWTDDLTRSLGAEPPTTVSLMGVLRTAPCLPFDAREIKTLRSCADLVSGTDAERLCSGGIFVCLDPVRIERLQQGNWASRGLVYISVKHLWPVVCAIVKVDAGRGFFGRQRVAYHVFASRDDQDGAPDEFSRGPVFTNPVDAFKSTLAIFRAAEIMKQNVKGVFD